MRWFLHDHSHLKKSQPFSNRIENRIVQNGRFPELFLRDTDFGRNLSSGAALWNKCTITSLLRTLCTCTGSVFFPSSLYAYFSASFFLYLVSTYDQIGIPTNYKVYIVGTTQINRFKLDRNSGMISTHCVQIKIN